MKRIILLLILASQPAWSFELSIPNSILVRSDTNPAGSVRLPIAPWSPGSLPSVSQGAIRRQVLQTPSALSTPLQLLSGLRDKLEQEGFEEVLHILGDMDPPPSRRAAKVVLDLIESRET